MNYTHKRFWEPSAPQLITSSVVVGALATLVTQPLDMVKTRIQQRAEGIGIRQLNLQAGYNPNKVFREIHAQGLGMRGLYTGIDSAIMGRSVYLVTRNLIYKLIHDRTKPAKPTNDLTAREKNILAAFAGSVAAIVSNPFEVALIRQQTDGALPADRRRGYGSFFDAYAKISQSEGGLGLMKGVVPSVLRAIALNASMSIPYNWTTECMYNSFGETDANRPIALLFAALWGTAITLPFDNVKTRLQMAFPEASLNRMPYENIVDCVRKVVQVESWQGFYVGFNAFYVKTLLYGFVTIYALDVITNRWKRKAGLKEYML